ncbi:DUF3613 domain-containing protein [Spongiibacter sp. KMU-158]|uniref:DUF3613 domain-containing protein n=1 Tax=Spongiibacter pelagi TaxID=2760804 RepID=A0A927C1T6_9GAMM|nr:DUF3613 domain-containing protein [Spongiibacter pelagi]MBD2858472.1 DUF3613 domain-containing protein [Spongiibacter pelagi]
MRASALLILSSLLLAPTVYAQDGKDSGYQSERPNTRVAQLMELQRSGKQESKEEQHLDGQTRTKVYTRYVDSFDSPIPERFTGDNFTASE